MIERTLYSLWDEITQDKPAPEYVEKMLHRVPDTSVEDRIKFLLKRAKQKVVLNVGAASGELHTQLKSVAKKCYGLDRNSGPHPWFQFDLDQCHVLPLPDVFDLDLIVCGEVLEHLSNPGHFLHRLRVYHCPKLFTVPNAFGAAGAAYIANKVENVNIDHVAWYSYRTLRTLLERHGFNTVQFWWYRGKPRTAEGLIMETD